jgi:hypothetical protein
VPRLCLNGLQKLQHVIWVCVCMRMKAWVASTAAYLEPNHKHAQKYIKAS